MNTEAIDAIYEHLKQTAAAITKKDPSELQEMKSKLDDYVTEITTKMPQQSKDIMEKEFEKCRFCAREWICVFKDSRYHADIKEDILKEEVMEFFFSMNEKIVAVQKNFFLLGMVNELLLPERTFTDEQRKSKIAKSRIRIQARAQGLHASYKNQETSAEGTSAHRLWFFGDERNFLKSNQEGLTDEEALDYLLD